MTKQNKNVVIAYALGHTIKDNIYILANESAPCGSFMKTYSLNFGTNKWNKKKAEMDFHIHHESLRFNSDANWREEAIEFFEKKYDVIFKITRYWVTIDTCAESKLSFPVLNIPHSQKEGDLNKKEAIFEALYMFSDFLLKKQ